MEYDEVLKYLGNLDFFGIKLGLERMEHLMKKLGNPEKHPKVVHVAGTNGKGSVCYMIGSILEKAGYNVGVYTSPHLVDFRERISINGSMISGSDISQVMKDIIPIADEMEKDQNLGHPTYFEITTAAALLYFKRKKVDFAVVEVGLGGRLDATNVVKPSVCVITNVTLEHTDYLGKKVPTIALEKAGIIKEGSVVVTTATGKALDVIIHKSGKLGCGMRVLGKDFTVREISSDLSGQHFEVRAGQTHVIKTPILGKYQMANAACAIASVEALDADVKPGVVRSGIENLKLAGRFEIVGHSPFVILDGAHNTAGIKSAKNALRTYFKGRKVVLILSICSDKDIPRMVKEIVPVADNVVVTMHSLKSRAADPKVIMKEVRKYKRNAVVKPCVKAALEHAASIAGKSDVILVTGSLYLVGDAKKILD